MAIDNVEVTDTAVVVPPEEIIAAVTTPPTPKAPERCISTSPDGLVQCELEAHGEDMSHQFSMSTIHGALVRYW